MRAMILAAGRGERMGTLTASTPKPLLKVKNKYLIEYAIESLVRAGIQDIIINVCYLGEKIKTAIGSGERYGARIVYSEEEVALETAGGIIQGLPWLGREPFVVVSADVITDFPIATLRLQEDCLAHLVVVDNPSFHPKGDFGLEGSYLSYDAEPTFTFANIGIYHPDLFVTLAPQRLRLNAVFKPAILERRISAEHYSGLWYNVGAPEDLLEFQAEDGFLGI